MTFVLASPRLDLGSRAGGQSHGDIEAEAFFLVIRAKFKVPIGSLTHRVTAMQAFLQMLLNSLTL